jgi:hypothetical protein
MGTGLELEFCELLDARHVAIEHHFVDDRFNLMNGGETDLGLRGRRDGQAREPKDDGPHQQDSRREKIVVEHF